MKTYNISPAPAQYNEWHDVFIYCVKLIKETGLYDKGWYCFISPRHGKRLGACNYRTRTIVLYNDHLGVLLKNNKHNEVTNTIKHELAHALSYVDYGYSQNHNNVWKEYCKALGFTNPTRLFGDKEIVKQFHQNDARYALINSETNEVYKYYLRYPRVTVRDISEIWIRGKKAETYGKLKIISLK